MRLVAQSKGGFYPVAPEVIVTFGEHLRIERLDKTYLLEPCCGEGMALGSLLEATKILPRNAYAIEIDEGRSATAQDRLSEARILGNTDFLGTTISPRSFSLVWLNPPFDHEFGGGERAGGDVVALARCRLARDLAPRRDLAEACEASRSSWPARRRRATPRRAVPRCGRGRRRPSRPPDRPAPRDR